jgi:hypothetical protein
LRGISGFVVSSSLIFCPLSPPAVKTRWPFGALMTSASAPVRVVIGPSGLSGFGAGGAFSSVAAAASAGTSVCGSVVVTSGSFSRRGMSHVS